MKSSVLFVMIAASTLSACANLSSVRHGLDTTNGHGVLIDIKQRAILASTRIEYDGAGNRNGGNRHSIVCAEPSPDALSAYAVDLAAKANLASGKSLGAGFGTAESSAFVGLRTQSIQLLRDQFFRACEAYLNQAASAGEYNFLIRRYQKQTAALLAIEQLTSMVSVPAAVVSAGRETRASTADKVVESNLQRIGALELSLGAAGTEEQKKTIRADIEKLRTANIDILSRQPGDAAQVTAPVGATNGALPGDTTKQADIKAIAEVVGRIVDGVILTDDFLQLCMIRYGAIPGSKDDKWLPEATEKNRMPPLPPRSMHEACMARMQAENHKFELENEAVAAYVASVIKEKGLSPKAVRDALAILVGRAAK